MHFIILTASFFYNILLGIILSIAFVLFILYNKRAYIYALFGTTSYSKGDMDKAIEWFRKANTIGISSPRTVISYAYLLIKKGNVDESESILTSLLNTKMSTDDEMLAKSNLALVLWKKGDLNGAAAILEEVIKDFRTTTVYGSLGYLLILKGDLEKALSFNLEAYDYNPSNAVILDNLGQTYYLICDYQKAEEIYGKLIPSNPAFPEAYFNYALVLEKLGKTDAALKALKKSLDYKFTFLSTVTREEVEAKLKELESKQTVTPN